MMLRRKRRARRARSLTDRIAIGAIVFSAGLLIISAIATDRSPESGDQARTEESERPSPAGQTGALAQRDDATSFRAETGVTAQRGNPAQTTARNRSNITNIIAEARLPDAEALGEPEDTVNLNTPTADIAALESEPDDTSPISVVRAQFTTGISESQPVNSVRSVFSTGGQVFSLDGKPLRRLYYFTEIDATQGETIVHRWEHEGEVMAETSFDVGGDSWPVYSSENLPPAMPGNWRVVVTDAQGNIIRADRFSYQAF